MTVCFSVLAIAVSMVMGTSGSAPAPPRAAPAPSHRVTAIYFHRTQRCPTCRRIGSLAEESINQGFPKELKTKAVAFKLVDFQDKKNASIVARHKIKSPTLVLLNVVNGKVVSSTPMPKVWQLFSKPKAFHAYVQKGVRTLLEQPKEEGASQE